MISDDEYLERIVAGIQAATAKDADVTWNEVINGRQFDVVVRFSLGALRYLVLVEVKNRTRRASASDMDGFILKARDQNANKAVFVTAAGFQAGAVTVANRHGIDLFTVSFDNSELQLPEEGSLLVLRTPGASPDLVSDLAMGEETPINQILDITLIYTDGRRMSLPNEQTQMTYYAEKSHLGDGRSLRDLVGEVMQTLVPAFGQREIVPISLPRPQRINPPDSHFFVAGKIRSLELVVRGHHGRPLRGNTLIEPTAFQPTIVYKNANSGEKFRFPLDELPLGMSRAEPGKFYFMYHPLRYYYCEKVIDGLVTWWMIESFQSGNLIRGIFSQKAVYCIYYIPVTDKKIIRRLKARLEDYRKLR